MPTDWRALELDRYGVLRISGPDAVSFLQGQLSNDMTRLSAERSLLAGLHTPQGRVIAILRLILGEGGEILALLPRELLAAVSDRLRRYVLRAKVRLADATPEWRVRGLIGPSDRGMREIELPQGRGAQLRADGELRVCVSEAPGRWVRLAPAAGGEAPAQGALEAAEPAEWIRLDVAAGVPQVYAQTSELFVAQMLNLDLLEAIAFDKGCYTGQEVIARAHYRGRVKRRMQRWRTSGPLVLAPGDAGVLSDGRSLKVVEAAVLADGRCDFLAVATFEPEPAPSPPGGAPLIAAESMPLPYPLPD